MCIFSDLLSKLFKSFSQPVTKIVDAKTGHILSNSEERKVLQELVNDVRTITDLCEWSLQSDSELLVDVQNNENVYFNNQKLAGAIGLKLPDELKVKSTGNSRFEYIYQDKVIGEAKSWLERVRAADNDTGKYVSAGWRRTMNRNKPTNLVPKMNLAAGAVQYAQIINNPFIDNEIVLKLVINKKWYLLYFNFNSDRFSGCKKLTLPSVRISKENKPVFDFSVENDYYYHKFSESHIIGVDVGISNYVSLVVWDTKNKRVVLKSTLSDRVHSLVNSVKATQKQVSHLKEKQDRLFRTFEPVNINEARCLYAEIKNQRESLSRKRRELAILAGQEIADLSYAYDNTLVVFEDLSHIKNTIKFGRWNRGELVKWTKHFVEQNGGRLLKVNPAYTSQDCHNCQKRGSFQGYHVFVCKGCSISIDRDINAAANIAQRLVSQGSFEKTITTRKKSKKLRKNKPKQSTPKTKKRLKYPKRKPTPKQVKKRKKKFLPEVMKNNCSVMVNDSDRTVVTDDTNRSSIRTLKKQHDNFNDILYNNLY